MSTSKLGYAFVLALILFPPTVSDAATIVQGAGDDYVWFTAGGPHAVITYEATGTVDAVITDNGDGTLTTVSRGDDGSGGNNDNGLVTYDIEFVNAPADYFLYFNFHEITDDSVYVNHGTGFNSVPGKSDDERWNSLDEGWNGLYEIGTGLGDNSDYGVDPGTPEYGWNVAGPSTVSFTVRNREDGVQWKDFVFSQRDDHTADDLDGILIGIDPPPPPARVNYDYATTGIGTGSGEWSATVNIGGTDVEFTAPMATPVFTQVDTLNAGESNPGTDGLNGWANDEDDGPDDDYDDGEGMGVTWKFYEATDTVTLTATEGPYAGSTWTIDTVLAGDDDDAEISNNYRWTADFFDIPSVKDVADERRRFASWWGDVDAPGVDGQGPHRHSGTRRDYGEENKMWAIGDWFVDLDANDEVDDDAGPGIDEVFDSLAAAEQGIIDWVALDDAGGGFDGDVVGDYTIVDYSDGLDEWSEDRDGDLDGDVLGDGIGFGLSLRDESNGDVSSLFIANVTFGGDVFADTANIIIVPEPGTIGLLLAGLLSGAAFLLRRKKRIA